MQQIHDRAISIANNIQKSFSNEKELVEKSDIYYALQDSFKEGSFKKKGKDLKEMASLKRDDYNEKLSKITSLMGKIKEDLEGTDCCEFKEDLEYGYEQCIYSKHWEQVDQKTRDAINNYQNLGWKLTEVKRDLKALKALIDNLEDNKEYSISMRLVQALQI